MRAFTRGLSVIEAMGHHVDRRTVAQIAKSARLSRTVARRMIATLVRLRFADSDGNHYWLTPKVLRLGLAYLHAQPYWRDAQLALEDLRGQTGESCSMAVLDDTEIVYVIRVPSRRILSINLTVGSRLPAHVVSLGRVLLAGLDEPALDAYLRDMSHERFTPRTVHSAEELRRALRKAQASGYAWVDGELDEAICGIAVPVRDRSGKPVAAINISLQRGQWTETKAASKFLSLMRQAAARIRSAMLS